MSIVIVQKTLVHMLSAMCEQSERERERERERELKRIKKEKKNSDTQGEREF